MFVDALLCLSPPLRLQPRPAHLDDQHAILLISPAGGNRNHASCSKQGASSPFERRLYTSEALSYQVCRIIQSGELWSNRDLIKPSGFL